MIKDKLMKKIKHASNQYGFCKNKSTVDAMEAIMSAWTKARNAGKFCLLVTLDVRNAFNSMSWISVTRSLNERRINDSLKAALTSYLNHRKICFKVAGDNRVWPVCGGVPQGSVLEPPLWNIVYDELLLTGLPKNVDIVG